MLDKDLRLTDLKSTFMASCRSLHVAMLDSTNSTQLNNKNSVYDALNQRAEVWQIGQSNETRILVDSYCATKGDRCSVAG